MAPEDENSRALVATFTLSSEQDIHLRVSIVVSRNHTGDDGVTEEKEDRQSKQSTSGHHEKYPSTPLKSQRQDTGGNHVRSAITGGGSDDQYTYLGKTSFVILPLGLKYGLFESAKNINTSDSETKVEDYLINCTVI